MKEKPSPPRRPELIKKELRELELSSSSSKEWLLSHPEDKLVLLLLEQDKILKDSLISEFEESCKYHRRHILNYSIKTEDNVDIYSLSNLLSSFNKVITATLSHIPGKIKTIPLYFDSVVASSFGIVLSTDWDPELIDTSYEKTFKKFFDIISKLDKTDNTPNDDLLSLFSEDKNLMRKYRSFYRGIAYYNSSVGLKWGGFLEDKKREHLIDYKVASKIYKSLADLDHPESEDIKVTGSIQGISLIDLSLQFVPHQKKGTRIKLSFDKLFKDRLKPLLGEIATILYKVVTEYDEVNDKVVTKKFLVKIEESDKSPNDS